LNRDRFSIIAAMLMLAAMIASCDKSSDTSPAASAPKATHLVVSDETGGRLVIIDAADGKIIDSITVGKRPRGVRALRDGAHVVVALSGSPIAGPGVDESKLPPPDRSADGIGIVDLKERKVVKTIPSGQDPETFALSPDEQTLYVSNEETAEMSVVDLKAGTVRTHVKACEEPEGVTVRPPDGREVYVACEGAGAIAVIDTQKLEQIAKIKTGARPRGVVFTPDGSIAFVSAENAMGLTMIDATTHVVKSTIVLPTTPSTGMPPRPMGLVLSPDASTLYVSNGRAKSVAELAVQDPRPAPRVFENIGARPWGIAINPDGKTLYTANGPSGDVSFVDVATGNVTKKVAVGGSPWGVIVIPQ
jgi:YVTN family beta-propeller protein